METTELVGPGGFDLLDAALLDLCMEYILPKVPLKALARLTLASGQAHALVLRAISTASFWEKRAAIYNCITATRPTSKGELLRIVEQASDLVELSWFGGNHSLTTVWRSCFPACEATQLSCLFRALVSRLAPPQVIEMVQTLQPFKLRLTHPDRAPYDRRPMPAAKASGLESLEENNLCAYSRHCAAWTAELVLQLAPILNQTDACELMEFASNGFGTVNPADVARLFAADLQPSERPAFYITALSFDDSTYAAIEPLVALAQGEPLQFVLDTIAAFAVADEQESLDRNCVYCPPSVNADSYAADFVEAWAQQVDFPHSWSVLDRLAMAHAVTSCNEVAKKGLGRIVLRWLPHLVEPIRALLPPEASPHVQVIENFFGGLQ